MTRAVAILLLALTAVLATAQTSQTDARLAAGLRMFPQADANKDGVLTISEAAAYRAKLRRNNAEGKPAGTAPTHRDVAYGPHERNKLDFWTAGNGLPAPVVVFIHGGGFTGGDKSAYHGSALLEELLKKGVACSSINYRFREHAPIQDILHDAARAVQFIRSKATEWHIDKARVAATGGSAGAGTSLWLGTRDDLADPASSDPVRRESSRVCAVVLHGTQATYDLSRWPGIVGDPKPEWMRSPNEDLEFYHFKQRADMTSPAGRLVLRECDMLGWISTGDAPVLCITNPADLGKPVSTRGEWLHHPKHAAAIQQTCAPCAVPCRLERGSTETELTFLLGHLGLR